MIVVRAAMANAERTFIYKSLSRAEKLSQKRESRHNVAAAVLVPTQLLFLR